MPDRANLYLEPWKNMFFLLIGGAQRFSDLEQCHFVICTLANVSVSTLLSPSDLSDSFLMRGWS